MKALFQVIMYLLPGHNAGVVPGNLLLQVPPGPGLAGGQGGLQGHVAEGVQGRGHEAAQAGQEAAVGQPQHTHRDYHQLQQAGSIDKFSLFIMPSKLSVYLTNYRGPT